MSIQKKFHAYPWVVSIVCAIIVALIVAVSVGLLCNCFWEITKTRILNFLYRICPCLDTVAHPNLPNNVLDERRITALLREQAHRLTDLVNGQADIRTAVETLVEDNWVLNPTSDTTSQRSLSGITIHQLPRQSPMEESSLPFAGDSASSGAQPSNSTVPACVTLFLPSRTPFTVWTWVTDFLRRLAGGPWYCWRGSVVIQAFLSIDSCVLAEIGELVKKCCSVENGFTLQIASWGIFYHNVDSIHLLILKEGDVPVNIEARWNKKRTGITMRGLYLNGAQIKATTEHTSTTLRSTGPPSKGCGNLDELHFPIEGFKGVEESFIYAAKVVEFDGMSLVVRSEASYGVPPKSFLQEILQDELQKIPTLAMKVMNSFLGSIPDLKTKQKLLIEYWKGNKVVIQFQNLPASEISTFVCEHPLGLITMCPSSRDREYWQRALHDLSEDHLSNGSSLQSSIVYSILGHIKFLLGEFEGALLDFNCVVNSNIEGFASTLLDRAMVKCALARYPEAMQDIIMAAEINPNSSDIKRFQACLEDILCMDSTESSTPQLQSTQLVFDLLTGDNDAFLDSRLESRMKPPMFESWREYELASLLEWTELREPSNDLPLIPDWTEVREATGTSHSHDFPQLLRDYLNLNGLVGYDSLRIGEKLGEGGQAEIFEARGTTPRSTKLDLVLKVFKQDFPLQTCLQPGVLQFGDDDLDHPSPFLCTALGVSFVEDGRCAFVYPRHWGDLRRLIHLKLGVPRHRYNPFEYPTTVKIMLQIAEGMRSLHIRNILHRDLKASNILVNADNPAQEDFRCMVADFECSVGVMGTGFWRAPEILTQLNHRTSESEALPWSKEADVYSFGMLCYEIITGDTPFGDLRAYLDWDVVLSGGRPRTPLNLHPKLRALIVHCWNDDPKQRPNFSKICKVLADVKGNAAGHVQAHQEWADLM